MKLISLNRNQIKYIVIIAMLIDHIAWAFVPTESIPGFIMHFIGRLTGPTMAFFVAEGYQHTRNVKRYAIRLGIFALISWIPFSLFEGGGLPLAITSGQTDSQNMFNLYLQSKDITLSIFPSFGVIYTLLLSLLAIWLWDKRSYPKWCKILGIIGLCVLSMFGDWPIFDILYALVFFNYQNNPKKKWILFSVISIFSMLIGGVFQLGAFMIPLLIQFCYNGESGSKKAVHKWFFYIFYPAHLLVLGLVKMLLL